VISRQTSGEILSLPIKKSKKGKPNRQRTKWPWEVSSPGPDCLPPKERLDLLQNHPASFQSGNSPAKFLSLFEAHNSGLLISFNQLLKNETKTKMVYRLIPKWKFEIPQKVVCDLSFLLSRTLDMLVAIVKEMLGKMHHFLLVSKIPVFGSKIREN